MNNRSVSVMNLSIASASMIAATLAIPVAAQEPVLEEIIVTTQRRAENLQDIPLAVSAFSGDQLDEMGIVDIKGITERTPGFTMGMFNPLQTQLYIRGIGSNEDGAGGDQSVIVFIDEVYGGRAAGHYLDLFDLERVEVLRGPQGTLFGKNVIGGAVNVITKKPTDDPEVVFEGTVGNLGLTGLRGRLMGPLGDNVFGKIAFSYKNRDGYLENKATDFPNAIPNPVSEDDLLDIDSLSARGHLRWVPRDDLELNFTASMSSYETSSQIRHYIGPPGSFWAADSELIPNYDGNHLAVLAEDRGLGEIDQSAVTGRIEWDINDAVMLTSVTGYRVVDGQNIEPLATENLGLLRATTQSALQPGAVPGLFGNNDSLDESDTLTQELRLSSTGGGNLQWVAGLYYLNEQTTRIETLGLGLAVPDGMGGSLVAVPAFTGRDLQDNETDSYAVFGQATYTFNDMWAVTLGARQTEEEKNIHRIGRPAPVIIPGLNQPGEAWNFRQKAEFSAFTPKASINFTPTADAMIYLSYSEGFKSGGWQGLSNLRTIAANQFQPEEAELIELGAKTEWFDNRLRLNAAVFSTDYTDLQILQLLVPNDAPPGTLGILLTQNAANAEIDGVEIEFTAQLSDRWLLNGALATLDTKFSDFFTPPGFSPPGGVIPPSREGNALRNAPDLAYNLLLRYEHPLNNGGQLSFQGEYRHKDKVFQDPDVLEVAAVPEYDVADFRVSYESPDSRYEVTGWVKNAFDEDYFLHNYPGTGDGFATPAPPRTYGITFVWTPIN